MIDRTLSLNALRAFEAAARHGSLTAAARELRVSVSSISRHVTLLEEHFDRKLLRRLPSGVKLTEQGKSYFSQISQAFELIERAGIQTTREIREQKLYVSLYTTFALEWMAPRLERFQTAFPDIELKLRISLDEADFDSDRVDIALTGAAAFDRRFHYDQVFESHLLPVCAPKFLTGKTPLEAPERLHQHMLLYQRQEVVFWYRWFEAMGAHTETLKRELRFDCATLAYQAARVGIGIALAQLFYIVDDLKKNDLTAPIPIAIGVPLTYRLACRKSRMDEPAIKAFRTWLLREAEATNQAIDALCIPVRKVISPLAV